MCCGGPDSICPTLMKAQCKCRCAKCRHCSDCGRETIGKAGALFGGAAIAATSFKKKRTYSVTSDSGYSDGNDDAEPSPPADPEESCIGSLCSMHVPTRHKNRGKLGRSFSIPTPALHEEEDGKSTDSAEPGKHSPPPRLNSLQIPTRYSRSDSISSTGSSLSSTSRRSSMARNASDDCCIQ